VSTGRISSSSAAGSPGWTALLAREEDPQREAVLLEGERIAFGGSGRNGGFMDASLTHGLGNGAAPWPDEMRELERLGRENFAAVISTMARHGIEAHLEQTGELAFATAPYHLQAREAAGLVELVEERPRRGFVEPIVWRARMPSWSGANAQRPSAPARAC
jgi:hypothetical protein